MDRTAVTVFSGPANFRSSSSLFPVLRPDFQTLAISFVSPSRVNSIPFPSVGATVLTPNAPILPQPQAAGKCKRANANSSNRIKKHPWPSATSLSVSAGSVNLIATAQVVGVGPVSKPIQPSSGPPESTTHSSSGVAPSITNPTYSSITTALNHFNSTDTAHMVQQVLIDAWLQKQKVIPELAYYIGVGIAKIQEYVHKCRQSRIYALAMSGYTYLLFLI